MTKENNNNRPIIVSGIKPTGDLHLGNYLGMLRQAVALQESGRYECLYMLADLHAMTQQFTKEELSAHTFNMTADLLATGIDPEKSTLFVQSQISEHANLAWVFNCLTSMGELQRMVEYKEKVEEGQVPNAGLFDYPVLMAADILLYNTQFVPAGEDQRQHIELSRTIARSFNSKFGETFIEPKIVVTETPRVMSLADPSKKMSKSQPQGCVFLNDESQAIIKKVGAAVTDSLSEIAYEPEKRPGISNLVLLYSEFSGIAIDKVVEQFKSKKYSEFKDALAEQIILTLAPIQEKRAKLLADKKTIFTALEIGRVKASALASKRMAEIRSKLGLI